MTKPSGIVCFLFSFSINLSITAQQYQPIYQSNEHSGGITVMTKDPGENILIAGDSKGIIYFHNLNTGLLEKTVKAHEAEVSQIQFNSNGRLLISATHDGEIKIYDFTKDKIIQAIYSPDYSGIRFVLFSIADGFIYFSGNKHLFKTRSDLTQKVDVVLLESDTITDAVITKDRSALIYSSGSSLKVLNTRTDKLMQEFNTGTSKIEKIELVRDTMLATWTKDGTINFWNYNLGQVNPKSRFFFKAGNPANMNFSNSGKLMCSGNIGNWARIWEPMERKIVQELFSHSSTVTSSCFGKDDDMIFTGSLDRNIILWKKGAPPPVPVVIQEEQKTDSSPIETAIIQHPDSGIEMNENNIPKIIWGRKVISDNKININSPDLRIYVYDNSSIDGDTMSLFFNGQWILDHYGVTKTKQAFDIKLFPNTNNYLVLFANNLGKSPPNTAVIEIDDGKSKRIFRLASDLKNCSAINFYYQK